MNTTIRKPLINNPFHQLMQSPIYGRLFACLAVTSLAWKDFRPVLSKNGALLASIFACMLMLFLVNAANRFSDRVSAPFRESMTTSKEGRAYIRSLAISGLVALFVYTLGIWQLARSFGLTK